MTFDPDSIPPVVRVLLDEDLRQAPRPSEVKRFFRRLLPELKRQAEWTRSNFSYIDFLEDQSYGPFTVTASGTLNPFSSQGICRNPVCRIGAAEQFARTLGLYADVITIPDAISAKLLPNQKPTNAQLLDFAVDVIMVKTLQPLIEAGIVRFRDPSPGFCEHHWSVFHDEVDKAASQLMTEIASELKFNCDRETLTTDTGNLHDPPMKYFGPIPDEKRRELQNGKPLDAIGRELFEISVRRGLSEVLLDLNSAARIRGPLFSGSRLDLLSLQALEGRSVFRDIEHWEAKRSIDVPWISHLSPTAIVRLREEAGEALPRFREKLLEAFGASTEAESGEVLMELRHEAAEVEAELRAVAPSRGRRFRKVAGILGITVSVYGFGAGVIPAGAALGSLGSLLALLHGSARKDEQDTAKLRAKPGYALVKAREILYPSHGH